MPWPISCTKRVMEKPEHINRFGEGHIKIARENNITPFKREKRLKWSEDPRSESAHESHSPPIQFADTSDDLISQSAQIALSLCPDLGQCRIAIYVDKGQVFIDGFVRTRTQKRTAEYCIENLSGVTDVFNRLILLNWRNAMPDNTNIYDRSVKSLNNSDHYEFSGESEYSRERSDPYQMVDFMIDHGLRLRTGTSQSDEQIREDVREIIARDVLLDSGMIDVEVVDGHVILTGEVATREIKRLAELSVENLSGVHDIINQLRIVDGTRHAN